ncbi:methylenetetrahydromethanopterin dehydrogenase [Labrys sp. LIt4]|uniref:NAD(P)-dependent methylenetetrahydromethanopterin dehydrogenase n=1 Tax=Labrys sp. LIt4 TaxID=2821355 RepID=UPI001ADF9833|nr:NAD(P)-dependent methylenetetrahydromethanopterin dehydrogenase [Labrys sp. LIt4]MBP0580588.1 methylenetetrahydromethanopterin dehydrogenase [Labrys sp. LIt4]
MARSILHMLSPLKHMSPFDVNMAVDAGFDVVIPYTGVTLEEIRPLVQDAIFSRAPGDGSRTSIFIGGKNGGLALDMLDAAKKAFVPPFALNLFTDPAGSFTTGAAMVAKVKAVLRDKHGGELAGRKIVIFGGTGVVAYCASVLVALEGGRPILAGHDGTKRVSDIAAGIKQRFGVDVDYADGSTPEARRAAVAGAEIVLSSGPAGVNILSAADLDSVPGLLVAADVNAVPPAGLEGVGVMANGEPFGNGKAQAVGALAIGNVKYKTELGLFRRLLATEKPISLDFRDAYKLALEIAG